MKQKRERAAVIARLVSRHLGNRRAISRVLLYDLFPASFLCFTPYHTSIPSTTLWLAASIAYCVSGAHVVATGIALYTFNPATSIFCSILLRAGVGRHGKVITYLTFYGATQVKGPQEALRPGCRPQRACQGGSQEKIEKPLAWSPAARDAECTARSTKHKHQAPFLL